MEEIAKILKNSGLPFYCAIGNHDTELSKHKIGRILSMPNRYYSFDTKDYTCLVLDANMNDPLKPYPNKEILWGELILIFSNFMDESNYSGDIETSFNILP